MSNICVNGTLTVKRISGRNGDFCVATLSCDIYPSFQIKDKILEQFEPGVYSGKFWIERIFPNSYYIHDKGISITEIRAVLADMDIDDHKDDPVPPPQPLPDLDPLDEEKVAVKPTVAPKPKAKSSSFADDFNFDFPVKKPSSSKNANYVETASSINQEDKTFASFEKEQQEAILMGQSFKFDRSLDREVLRQQTQYVKSIGYHLDPKTQAWVKF